PAPGRGEEPGVALGRAAQVRGCVARLPSGLLGGAAAHRGGPCLAQAARGPAALAGARRGAPAPGAGCALGAVGGVARGEPGGGGAAAPSRGGGLASGGAGARAQELLEAPRERG